MTARKRNLQPVAPAPASQPAPITLAYASAMQAFSRFEADAEQQKLAWDWIMRHACGIGVWAFRDNQRETDIMLGRHFVGQQIMGLVNVNLSALRRSENAG